MDKYAPGPRPDEIKQCNTEVEYVLIGAGNELLFSYTDLHRIFEGLPRTGTLSTFVALEKLLPGKCHHMLRAVTGPNDGKFWTKASQGELTDDDWKEFIRYWKY